MTELETKALDMKEETNIREMTFSTLQVCARLGLMSPLLGDDPEEVENARIVNLTNAAEENRELPGERAESNQWECAAFVWIHSKPFSEIKSAIEADTWTSEVDAINEALGSQVITMASDALFRDTPIKNMFQ